MVKEAESRIDIYLKDEKYDPKLINDFHLKFSILIEQESSTDHDFKEFYNWWKSQQQKKRLMAYLEYIKSLKNFSISLDKKPLYEYYVNNEAVLIDIDEWSLNDEQIISKNYDKVTDINFIIEDFINENSIWCLFIGASPGIGKTSMTRIVGSNYASDCLEHIQKANLSNESLGYIPIIVFLKDGVNNIYEGSSLESLLHNILNPEDNQDAHKIKILLVLDGLDEYIDKKEELMNRLTKIHKRYPNTKVILTTRPDPMMSELIIITEHQKQEIGESEGAKYVRLLPFTNKQVDDFLLGMEHN